MTFEEFESANPLFRVIPVGNGVTLIRDVMDVGMYLVEGARSAALLDTGIGIGELAPVIREITSLPVTVYLTHGHVDHVGGISGFRKIVVPEADAGLMAVHSAAWLRRDFASAYNPQLMEIEDLRDHMPDGAGDICVCRPGDVIDLGGRTLIVLDLCGHTRGSVGFLDDKTGMLFAGDGCNNATFLFLRESASVAEYRDTMIKLKADWMPKIRRILICHAYYLNTPITVVDDMIDCCDRVLAGNGTDEVFELPYKPFRNGVARWAADGKDDRRSYDGCFGNLIFSESRNRTN